MKKNYLYYHFKGTIYKFQSIFLPKEEPAKEIQRKMQYVGKVRFHENTHDLG